MPLSNEDNLRFNVLMAQQLKAIRIDEGKMQILALTTKGEAKIKLSPNEKNDRYLKHVRDFLSNKILGMPGGFPIFISHWNRLGEAKSSRLDKLLLLGEESATIAVVNSKDLTAELAVSAWWVYQSVDNARSMLANKCVVEADIGKELAKFLLEFLPYEEHASNMLISVRLVLQENLITEEEKLKLWKKAKSKNTLYLGFLDILPDQIPEPLEAHKNYLQCQDILAALLKTKNNYAHAICHLFSPAGQTFINTAKLAFKRPPNQIVYEALIGSIQHYIANLLLDTTHASYNKRLLATDNTAINLDKIAHYCDELMDQQSIKDILTLMPQLTNPIRAMLILSKTSATITFTIFSQSTAQGTLMRKKLKLITDAMLKQLTLLH